MDNRAEALAEPAAAVPAAAGALRPAPFVVRRRARETHDTFTLSLQSVSGPAPGFAPGQFNMLYAFGVGEVPISISGDPARPDPLLHTVRSVGVVTRALERVQPGDVLGVRGPFGTAWPVERAHGHDVVVVAGGIGLAPLRPAILHLLRHRALYGRVALFYGARSPRDLLFPRELSRWRSRFDIDVAVTVDRATTGWQGRVGVVTRLVERAAFEPHSTLALVCGPEIMIRFAATALVARGVAPDAIFVSLERNMKCGVGLCGHCQMGAEFVCRDGPVFPYARVAGLLNLREV